MNSIYVLLCIIYVLCIMYYLCMYLTNIILKKRKFFLFLIFKIICNK